MSVDLVAWQFKCEVSLCMHYEHTAAGKVHGLCYDIMLYAEAEIFHAMP